MKESLNREKENMQLIFLWPFANKKDMNKLTACTLSKYNATIYNTKDVFLTFKEFNQLIYDLYKYETWMTKVNKIHINSLLRKATWCYSKNKPTTMILLSFPSNNSILLLKEEIRQATGLGKHSIHTIENTQEAIFIWERYALSSVELSQSFHKSIKWKITKFYYYLRINFFRLIGYIEQ